MKCSKIRCPMQHYTVPDDCDLEDCPYRTISIEPQEMMEVLCNHIADLVVKKLAEQKKDA